jgi:hypothetical protein
MFKFGVFTFLVVAVLIVLGLIGYVQCVIQFIACDFQAPYKAEILYGAGTFLGLGAVLGWFNFGK